MPGVSRLASREKIRYTKYVCVKCTLSIYIQYILLKYYLELNYRLYFVTITFLVSRFFSCIGILIRDKIIKLVNRSCDCSEL